MEILVPLVSVDDKIPCTTCNPHCIMYYNTNTVPGWGGGGAPVAILSCVCSEKSML